MVGASANTSRPSYFAMKYLKAKGFRVIPVNPGQAGQEILGEKVYAVAGRHRGTGRHRRHLPQFAKPRLPSRSEAIRIGGQGRVDAAWRAQRRGGEARRRCRAESGDESLPQDRVRPALRRAQLGWRQLAQMLSAAAARSLAPRACSIACSRPRASDAQSLHESVRDCAGAVRRSGSADIGSNYRIITINNTDR